MKIYIKNGRKCVKSNDGREYSYYTVLAVAIATLTISILLMGAGIVLIFSEPVGNISGTFLKVMFLKTMIGIALSYVSYLTFRVFKNLMEKF